MTDALRELAWRHVKAKESQPLTVSELGDLRDALTEFERLRRIEKAIRECPTTSLPGCKALIFTTQLRDALEAK